MRFLNLVSVMFLTVVGALEARSDMAMDSRANDPFYAAPENAWSSGRGSLNNQEYVLFRDRDGGGVQVHDLLRNGIEALNGHDLSKADITMRVRDKGAQEYAEEELTNVELLLLELADYPAQSGLRQKLISMINEDNFDVQKFKQSKAVQTLARFSGNSENRSAFDFIKEKYPSLTHSDGSLNHTTIDEAQSDQDSKAAATATVQCTPEQDKTVLIKDSDPCSFSQVWSNQNAKRIFREFKQYFRKNRDRNVTYAFSQTSGPSQLTAAWKFDGKGFRIQKAYLSSTACPGGASYDLFAYPQAIKELLDTKPASKKVAESTAHKETQASKSRVNANSKVKVNSPRRSKRVH